MYRLSPGPSGYCGPGIGPILTARHVQRARLSRLGGPGRGGRHRSAGLLRVGEDRVWSAIAGDGMRNFHILFAANLALSRFSR